MLYNVIVYTKPANKSQDFFRDNLKKVIRLRDGGEYIKKSTTNGSVNNKPCGGAASEFNALYRNPINVMNADEKTAPKLMLVARSRINEMRVAVLSNRYCGLA